MGTRSSLAQRLRNRLCPCCRPWPPLSPRAGRLPARSTTRCHNLAHKENTTEGGRIPTNDYMGKKEHYKTLHGKLVCICQSTNDGASMAIDRMGFCTEDNHQGRYYLSYSELRAKTLHRIMNQKPEKVHNNKI